MADPTQLSGVGGGYVDNKMVRVHILNRDWTKKPLLNKSYLDQEISTKTTRIEIFNELLSP